MSANLEPFGMSQRGQRHQAPLSIQQVRRLARLNALYQWEERDRKSNHTRIDAHAHTHTYTWWGRGLLRHSRKEKGGSQSAEVVQCIQKRWELSASPWLAGNWRKDSQKVLACADWRVLQNAKHGLQNKAEQSCSIGVTHDPNQARRNTASSVLMRVHVWMFWPDEPQSDKQHIFGQFVHIFGLMLDSSAHSTLWLVHNPSTQRQWC